MKTEQNLIQPILQEISRSSDDVTFRGFNGPSDYPIILDLINASKKADEVKRSDTLEDVTRNYTHLHNCDPYKDMLFAEVDGKPAGYIRLWWDVSGDGEWIGSSIAFVVPEHRSRGIGSAFLRFLEARLEAVAAGLVEAGSLPASTPRFSQVFIQDTETPKEALLLKNGYQPVRYSFSMVRPTLDSIPDLPLPDGLEIRPVIPEHRRAIWDAAQEAFRDHWGYTPEPEEEYQKMLEDPSIDPGIWQVAWEGDQVAGMVLNFIIQAENEEYQRKRGYTESICVRRPWRRRGLAKALIASSLKLLKSQGLEEAALGVDAENLSGALGLYESMGYQVVQRFTIMRKDLARPEK